MYKKPIFTKTQLKGVALVTGETIEQKVRRIVHNNEPIGQEVPSIYTERKDGVNPATNIRTDRWETATDAMDKVSGSIDAGREQRGKVIPLNTDDSENSSDKNTATE